jgi:hypothetical protein
LNIFSQANSLNESIDAVLEWIPRAEDELSFRQIPSSEDEILRLIESHSVCDVILVF